MAKIILSWQKLFCHVIGSLNCLCQSGPSCLLFASLFYFRGRDDSKEDLSHRKDGEFNKAKGKGRKRQWEKKGQSSYAAEESQQIPKRKRRYFDQPTSSKNGSQSKDSLNVSDSRLKAYGLKGKEMKKFKWKKRTRPQ